MEIVTNSPFCNKGREGLVAALLFCFLVGSGLIERNSRILSVERSLERFGRGEVPNCS